MDPLLTIDDLIGHRVSLRPGETATIGRNGTFLLGEDDPFMHRFFLSVWFQVGWQVYNRSDRISCTLVSSGRGATQGILGPKAPTPLPLGRTSMTFETRKMPYEIEFTVSGGKPTPPRVPLGHEADITHQRLVLTEDERRLLTVLAQPLRAPGSSEEDVPSIEKAASMLEWTTKKTNHKAERLAKKLREDGQRPTKPYRIYLARYGLSRYSELAAGS